jgi:hypothetical protein
MKLHLQKHLSLLGAFAACSILFLATQTSVQAEDQLNGCWVGKVLGIDTYLYFSTASTCSFNNGDNCQVIYPLTADPYNNISLEYKDETGTLELKGNFNGETIQGNAFTFSRSTGCPLPSKWTPPHKPKGSSLLTSSIERSRRTIVVKGNSSA